MNKIVFLDAETMGGMDCAKEFSLFGDYKEFETSTKEEVIERIKDADIIITNKAKVDAEAMAHASKLKLVCVAATGMNNIDLDAAKAKGILVKNVSAYSTDAVAQHTFAMLFAMLNHIVYFDQYVKGSSGYSKSLIFSNFGRHISELKGKTFGVIGLGAIGRRVAEIASVFGANVIYYSSSGKNDDSTYSRVSLDELLGKSDVISIHAPLNENTRNLITSRELNAMKKESILINTGRGGIINENDLAIALNNNVIQMAALDVFIEEPINSESPLLKLNDPSKILLSPHVAWASVEARIELIKGIKNNIKQYLQ